MKKTTSKIKMTLEMKTTSKRRWPKDKDDIKNEDYRENEDNSFFTVPRPSVHNLSCAVSDILEFVCADMFPIEVDSDWVCSYSVQPSWLGWLF